MVTSRVLPCRANGFYQSSPKIKRPIGKIMHVHPAQQETDLNKLRDFIEKNAFAVLAVVCDGKIEANHLPVELDRKSGPFGTIRCHIGLNNPACEIIAKADEALFLIRLSSRTQNPWQSRAVVELSSGPCSRASGHEN